MDLFYETFNALGAFGWLLVFLFVVWLVSVWVDHDLYRQGEKLNLPQYRIHKEWDVRNAKNRYQLQELNKFGNNYECTGYSGGHTWAKKTAQHYKCKIVKDDEEAVEN